MTALEFLQFVEKEPTYGEILKDQDTAVPNLRTLALLLSTAFLNKPRKMAVAVPTLYDAQSLIDMLNDFVPQSKVVFFPFDEVLRIESLGTSREMREERLNALTAALAPEPVIFVTHSAAFCRLIRGRNEFEKRIFTVRLHDNISRSDLIEKVEAAGYFRVNKVTHCFEYAVRGEIFDIWSANSLTPVRVEFFDETVEEIRLFSPETEESERNIDSFTIVPAGEFVLSPSEKEAGALRLAENLSGRSDLKKLARDELGERIDSVLGRIRIEGMSESEARYLPFFDENCRTVADFLGDFSFGVFHPDDFAATAQSYIAEEREFFNELFRSGQALSSEQIYRPLNEVLYGLKHHNFTAEDSSFKATEVVYHNTNLATSLRLIESLLEDGETVRVCLEGERLAAFKNHLLAEDYKFPLGTMTVSDKSLSSGFGLPSQRMVFLSAAEIFGLAKQSGKFLTRFKEAKLIKKYEELEPGDFVVHEDYGIGQFLGVQALEGLDYLKIKYGGENNYLYVPLSKFKLIRKYAGKEGTVPTLDTIGGTSWARRKEKIKSRVSYLADKLLAIYAERLAKPGYAFMSEDEMEQLFADDFPYPLTESQQKAWTEIKEDMESSHPMDRLLAGDVGFGKTELALRACYKAILSGKQAAILCPTTILAKQHTEVAVKRFKGFGVEIATLSRFTRPKELKRDLKRIKDGKIHLVIGTHKLLGADVAFADLGLLVIDEEQRFGVTHKERIKEMTANIDVLTLTATPIPRTLQMSLLNVKSLSLLSQAPQNRMPIKTYVSKYDQGLVKEVIARELGRGGQVYYLHNRIDSIYSKARQLQTLFPQARIKVVHGALQADDIGEIMNEFYDGEVDILVCTTIIETGLDIPNVNTIIVENADRFGLAQLYQIKGRVGRSNRLAYAYLFYEEYKNLSEQGRKRLKAIKDFTELGSGYKIANQDLNIRGAGDILGKEQAGFIDSVGYDSYVKLLAEVMKEKQLSDESKNVVPVRQKFELSFSLDSHIPASYAIDSDRINIYQELNDIADRTALKKYEAKIKDVYGPLPEEVRNLFLKREIEIYLNEPFVDSFVENIDRYVLTLAESYTARDGMLNLLEQSLNAFNAELIVRFARKKIVLYINRTPDYLLMLYNILVSLDSIRRA